MPVAGPGGVKRRPPWRNADRRRLRFFSAQPICNYNFGGGWYATSSPIFTAQWSAQKSGDVWTVPVGVGLGKIFHVGDQPIDLSIRPFYNVHRPDGGARWTMQIVLKFLFPQAK